MLPALAARLACYASREGSVELFECARCYLGSWAAILAARQRLLPALWALCGFPEEDRYDCFSTARRLWCRSRACICLGS